MSRIVARIVGTTLCALATASCGVEGAAGSGATTAADTKAAGSMATDFAVRDTDGRTFRLSDHLGKEVVLLDFWSTFCEPCKAEFPRLRAMYGESKAKGLLVVGVSMDGPE